MKSKINLEQCARVLREDVPLAAELGITCREISAERCLAQLDAGNRFIRPGGSVAGPAMMAMADVVIYLAIMARLGPMPMAVTSNLTMNFLSRPGLGLLLAEGRIIKLGRRLAFGEVQLYSEGAPDQIAAHATVTYALPEGR